MPTNIDKEYENIKDLWNYIDSLEKYGENSYYYIGFFAPLDSVIIGAFLTIDDRIFLP